MTRREEHFLRFLNRTGRDDRSLRSRRSEPEVRLRRLVVPWPSAPENSPPRRHQAPRATRPLALAGDSPAESGFAYLLAMVFVMVMIIGASVAVERGIAQARRQREALTIWRGEQYVRAIRMYYKKTQHYPQTVEDLQKGIANIHFLRPEAYKNPMNKQDGTWRLIYVNPAGQIIGSVRYANLQQMALIVLNNGQMPPMPGAGSAGAPATPAPATPPAADAPGAPTEAPQSPDINNGEPQPAPPPQGQPQAPGQPGQPGLFGASGQPAGNPLLLMKPTGPVTGPVVGGFLTGVALAPDKPSQKVYEGGKKYIQWEFIWNPLVDQARAIQAGGNGSATGSIGGANGAAGGILGGAGGMNGGGLFPTAPNQTTTPPPQPQQPNQTQQPPSQPQQ